MNFWTWLDRNSFGLAFVVVILSIVGTVGGLVAAGKIGNGPAFCTVPCSEVRAQ